MSGQDEPNSDLTVLFGLQDTSVGLLTSEIRASLTSRTLWTDSVPRPWMPKRFPIVVMGKSNRKDFANGIEEQAIRRRNNLVFPCCFSFQ